MGWRRHYRFGSDGVWFGRGESHMLLIKGIFDKDREDQKSKMKRKGEEGT